MTRHWLYSVFICWIALLMLSGCGEETATPPPSPTQKVPAPQPKQPAPQPSATQVPVPAPERYVYDPAGRRDPFEPLTSVKKAIRSEETLTPLQKFDLGQLRLIGVIVGKGEPRAMVIAPDGKSYILKRGTRVGRNDGTVVGITPEEVRVQERYYDFSGVIRTNIQAIQLPKREGVE